MIPKKLSNIWDFFEAPYPHPHPRFVILVCTINATKMQSSVHSVHITCEWFSNYLHCCCCDIFKDDLAEFKPFWHQRIFFGRRSVQIVRGVLMCVCSRICHTFLWNLNVCLLKDQSWLSVKSKCVSIKWSVLFVCGFWMWVCLQISPYCPWNLNVCLLKDPSLLSVEFECVSVKGSVLIVRGIWMCVC